MRLNEFLLLTEFRSNIPQGQSFEEEKIKSWFENEEDSINQFKLQLSIPNSKSIMVFEYIGFGPNDKFIILTDRVKKEKDIVGYLYLKKVEHTNFWQSLDVTIYPDYQGKGLGLDLYVKLINDGYNLINGYSLSTQAEKLWRKLPQFVNVNVWDKEENKIEKYSEKPKFEISKDDTQHRYFWLATSKNPNIKESIENNHPAHNHLLEQWFKGGYTPCFRTEKYGQEGDL